MNKIKIIIPIAVIATAFIVGGAFYSFNNKEASSKKDLSASKISMTMYKSPNCGCCGGYADELKKKGVNVEVVAVENMDEVKNKYDIPEDMRSCHTIAMGDYFVEGHVPFEAIEKLSAENPKIDGIAMPGMPAGSLGMPGEKTEAFEVYQVTGGKYSSYILINQFLAALLRGQRKWYNV